MYILLKHSDTLLREVLNGSYEICYFSTNITLNLDILFFKFTNGKVKINLNGNDNFISNGFLYDTNNITNIFQYIPKDNDKQILNIEQMKNVEIIFFDKDDTKFNLHDYTLILKKIK